MPRVVFTSNLQRHVDCPEHSVRGTTVRAALEEVFKAQPRVRDYVLDEQGHMRKHVVIFVEGQRAALERPVSGGTEIYVMQALSGG
jgi:molybdopterin synthase sulfur carrier subunit